MPKIFKEIHIIDFKKKTTSHYPPKEMKKIYFYLLGRYYSLPTNLRIRALNFISTVILSSTVKLNLINFLCLSFSACKLLPIKSV
uniref:Uncharacterized protein n=1 Tax=Marmota marmota marmota TaxID=9994 RepID=A0A8C5YYQ1_MARMA